MHLESADNSKLRFIPKLFDVHKATAHRAQRSVLKEPLGQLVVGTSAECNQSSRNVQATEKPRQSDSCRRHHFEER